MNLNRLSLIILAGAMLLGINSCKDDEDTTVAPSLDGYISFTLPEYILPNAEITMTPKGVSHPDGEGIGYYWKVTPTMTQYDTTRFESGLDRNGNPSDGSFTHVFSDTLQTYSVYAYAYADGYTSTSTSAYATVVSGGLEESITNLHISSFATSEDINGITYYYKTIGSTDWMVTNASNTLAGAPYFNCKAMSDVLGRYYSYEEALTVCPDGWTLPSEQDWVDLAKAAGAEDAQAYNEINNVAAALMGNGYFNDKKMWEYWPAVGDITNETGMSIIPAGYAMLGQKSSNPQADPFMEYNYPAALFKGYANYAMFWTADEVAEENGMAYYRYLICNQPNLMIGKADNKTFGASVRCIRKK